MKVDIAVVSLAIGDDVRQVPHVPLQAVEDALQELEDRKADLVLFPQYTVSEDRKGRAVGSQGVEYDEEAGKIGLLQAYASENQCYVVYNSLLTTAERIVSVSRIIGRDGSLAGEYVKTHQVAGIDIELDLGDELPVFQLDFGKVALLTGTDLYIPEIAEIYSIRGAECLLCSMGTAILRDDTETHRLLKGRAVADYMYVAASTYASRDPLYMASNVEVYQKNELEIDTTGDVTATFNAFGLGKHTGRAAVYDLRGETIASTGRESGTVIARIDMHRKRHLAQYNYGTGSILVHQNERGVFKDLGLRAAYDGRRYKCEKPVISLVHIGYKDTIQSSHEDKYADILMQIAQAAQFSDFVICSEYSQGDNGRPDNEHLSHFLQGCSSIARDNRCYVAVNEVLNGTNTSFLYDREGLLAHTHQKVNPLGMMYHKQLPAGTDIEVVELDFARVGLMICADTYCQEIPRIHALKGAEIIVIQSQSWGYDANAINEGFSRAWAIENGAFVVMSNFPTSQVVHRSNVIDPTGETVFASFYNKEGIYSFEVDLEAVRSKPYYLLEDGIVRRRSDFRQRMMDARRPELYSLLTGAEKVSGQDLSKY